MCAKFRAIVRLDRLGSVSEESDGPFDEINSAVAALFKIERDEPLLWSFVNERVPVELIGDFTGITGSGNVFDVQLSFNAQLHRRVVFLRFAFILFGRSFWRIFRRVLKPVQKTLMPWKRHLQVKLFSYIKNRYLSFSLVQFGDLFRLFSIRVSYACWDKVINIWNILNSDSRVLSKRLLQRVSGAFKICHLRQTDLQNDLYNRI